MSQSEQKGADQLTRLCNMYLGGNLGKCLIFRLPSRAIDIIILPRFGSFRLEPIFTGVDPSEWDLLAIDVLDVPFDRSVQIWLWAQFITVVPLLRYSRIP